MNTDFLRPIQENFAVRVFAALAVLICFISFSFSALCIRQERISLRESAIHRGHLLNRILAHSARIGIFSENEKLLAGPIEAILQQEGVLVAEVYSSMGDLLGRQEKPETVNNLRSAATYTKTTIKIHECVFR